MNFKIVCIGKIKESYYRDMLAEFVKQINKRAHIEIVENPDEKIPKNPSDAENKKIIQTESEKSLGAIKPGEFVVALTIDGKHANDAEFENIIEKTSGRGFNTVTFVIGGSLGMSQELVARADYKLSFSNMTFPHQLMRVMLASKIASICDK